MVPQVPHMTLEMGVEDEGGQTQDPLAGIGALDL